MSCFEVNSPASDDRKAGLAILYRDVGEADRTAAIERAEMGFGNGELEPAGFFVARQNDRVIGAILSVPSAGACGLIWPPRVGPSGIRSQVEDALLQAAVVHLRERDMKLVQALLPPNAGSDQQLLQRNGFRYISSLDFLCHSPNTAAIDSSIPDVESKGLAEVSEDTLKETLLQTYEGSLDCPELAGVLTADEIVAGHRAQGTFLPDQWRVVYQAGRPAAVLLMNLAPEGDAWEIVYMGVIPSAQRHGLGRQLVHNAVNQARRNQVGRIILSVDQRNTPAMRLYLASGFESYDRREAFLLS